jgi:uncharacterized membrane protein (Fun14 family)
MTDLDVLPLVGTVGGGFLAGTFIGYAVKIVLKFVAVIAGLFVAGLVYLQEQHVIIKDWTKLQGISQIGFTALSNTIINNTSVIGSAQDVVTLSNFIPLSSSASAGTRWG